MVLSFKPMNKEFEVGDMVEIECDRKRKNYTIRKDKTYRVGWLVGTEQKIGIFGDKIFGVNVCHFRWTEAVHDNGNPDKSFIQINSITSINKLIYERD